MLTLMNREQIDGSYFRVDLFHWRDADFGVYRQEYDHIMHTAVWFGPLAISWGK